MKVHQQPQQESAPRPCRPRSSFSGVTRPEQGQLGHPRCASLLSAWLAAGLLLAGCSPAEHPYIGTLRHDGPDFEVWAVEGLEACGGTYDYMQGWLDEFRRRMPPGPGYSQSPS